MSIERKFTLLNEDARKQFFEQNKWKIETALSNSVPTTEKPAQQVEEHSIVEEENFVPAIDQIEEETIAEDSLDLEEVVEEVESVDDFDFSLDEEDEVADITEEINLETEDSEEEFDFDFDTDDEINLDDL